MNEKKEKNLQRTVQFSELQNTVLIFLQPLSAISSQVCPVSRLEFSPYKTTHFTYKEQIAEPPYMKYVIKNHF